MIATWLIGRFEESGGTGLAAELAEAISDAEIHRFETPDDALRRASGPADLVVVAQRRPAEFSRRSVEVLIGSQPLARFVVGLGPWCASHGRSERLWPDVVVVPLRDLPARLRLERRRNDEPALPLTASRDEAILDATCRPHVPSVSRREPRSFAIIGVDRAYIEMVADVARNAGLSLAAPQDATVLVLDLTASDESAAVTSLAAKRKRPDVRWIAATAHSDDRTISLLRQAGADIVLPKPCGIDEMTTALTA